MGGSTGGSGVSEGHWTGASHSEGGCAEGVGKHAAAVDADLVPVSVCEVTACVARPKWRAVNGSITRSNCSRSDVCIQCVSGTVSRRGRHGIICPKRATSGASATPGVAGSRKPVRDAPGIVIDIVIYPRVKASGKLHPVIEIVAGGGELAVRNVPHVGFGLPPPPPVVDGLPTLGAASRYGVPNRAIVTEIIEKVGSTALLVNYRDRYMRVQIGEIDDVGTAAEAAERRRARGHLCRRNSCAEREGERENEIAMCAGHFNLLLYCT